ncbi:ABC-type polar amino acid transport system ATPase subunit [Rhizobium leguminosarum]|nr:ABC-type polar amino acid transport system ATPase subunit [Rhizobium esperanzae]MBB6267806.1 ABC-type polar amino acid transport system ATPase subunit [Rhizobium leguminosarum]
MYAQRHAVRLVEVNKWYGQFHVLKDIDLDVGIGERIVIAGPSGSGKSTMIRCINRLEEHKKGTIVVDGIELTNEKRLTKCAVKSAWRSSTSTSSRT